MKFSYHLYPQCVGCSPNRAGTSFLGFSIPKPSPRWNSWHVENPSNQSKPHDLNLYFGHSP
jgi:hypothetical protein